MYNVSEIIIYYDYYLTNSNTMHFINIQRINIFLKFSEYLSVV